ncbi:hypothetical protein ACFWM1_23255 [Nocardia sp. NPDC058379]|uniref:hypothetical protein n=1 Tax=unclassified Nocardia TaxID=2637762 RepID=UPI0036601802
MVLPIQKLQTTRSGDHQKGTSALGTLGSGLGTAATLTRLLRAGQSGANPLTSKEITTAATAAAPRPNVTVDASAKTRARRHQDNASPAGIATSTGASHVTQVEARLYRPSDFGDRPARLPENLDE